MKKLIRYTFLLALAVLFCCGATVRAGNKPFTYQIEVNDQVRSKLFVPVKSSGKWTLRYKLVTDDDTKWTTAVGETGKTFEKDVPQGRYLVEVYPENVTGLAFGDSNARSTSFEVTAWGDVQWLDLSWAFSSCQKMTLADHAGKPDLSRVTSLHRMFLGCLEMNSASLADWDVSHITDMNGLFGRTVLFNQDLSRWDVSHVTDMREMFKDARAFNQPLGAWTFAQNVEFEMPPATSEANYQLSLNAWGAKSTSPVGVKLRVPNLFYGTAKAAREKLVSEKNWYIAGDFEKMGTPRGNRPFVFEIETKGETEDVEVTLPLIGKDMALSYQKIEANAVVMPVAHQNGPYTFKASPKTHYLVKVNPQGVITFQNEQMMGASLMGIWQWGDVAWLTMERAFYNAGNLKELPLFGAHGESETVGDAPDLSLVKSCAEMFSGARNVKGDIAKWDVSGVEDMTNMFFEARSFFSSLASWKLTACRSIGLEACGMSPENYSETLEGWASQIPNLQMGVKVNARGLIYQKGNALAARKRLIDEKLWEFSGDTPPEYLRLSVYQNREEFFVGERVSIQLGKTNNIGDNEVVWSTDPNIPLEEQGPNVRTFTATTPGRVTIKVRAEGNGAHDAVEAEVTVVILPKPTAIKVSCPEAVIDETQSTIKIESNVEYTFTPTVEPLTTIPDLHWRVTPETGVTQKQNSDGTWTLRVPKAQSYQIVITFPYYYELAKSYTLEVSEKKEVLVDDVTLFVDGTPEQKSAQLTATVKGLVSNTVTWSIDEAGKAFVDLTPDGKVTAKSVGVATVTATSTEDTNIKGACQVTVANLTTGVTISMGGAPVAGAIEAVQHVAFVLKAKVEPATAPQNVTWLFDAGEFAKEDISEGARFIPLKEGHGFTITAKSVTDVSASVTVNVKKGDTPTPQPAVPTSITIPAGDKTITLKKGDTRSINLVFAPTENVNKAVTVTLTPADAPLTVTALDGVVTLKADKPIAADQEVKVVVKSAVGEANDFCTVQLKKDEEGTTPQEPVAPTSITIPAGDKTITLKKGDTRSINLVFSPTANVNKVVTVTLTPADAPLTVTALDGVVTLTADNPIAVDQEVKVVVKSAVGEANDFCTVQLKKDEEGTTPQEPVAPTSITIPAGDKTITLKKGDTRSINLVFSPTANVNKVVTVTLTPADAPLTVTALDGVVTLTADNPIAVDQEVKVVVKSAVGEANDFCTVQLKKDEGTITPPVALEGITLTPTELTLVVGEKKQLGVAPKPAEATLPEVTWTVTPNEGIVTVSAQGMVKAIKAGSAVVTASAGGKTATCTVRVNDKTNAVEDGALESLVVAPNPFGAQLRIRNAEAVAGTYEVINALGSVVRSGVFDGSETTVDTEALPAGIYFVRVYGVNSVQKSVRVIKY